MKMDSDYSLSNLTHFSKFFGSIEKEKSAQPRRLLDNKAHINNNTYIMWTTKNYTVCNLELDMHNLTGNPSAITNLSDHSLTEQEISVLNKGLKYDILPRILIFYPHNPLLRHFTSTHDRF